MRRLIITIILIVLMLVINFTNIPYRIAYLFIMGCFIIANQLIAVIVVSNMHCEGELIIRRQKGKISFSSLIFSAFWSLFAIGGSKEDIFLAILFWTVPVTEIVSNRIFKKKKPAYIVINKKELLLNELWSIRRNIENVKKIGYYSLSGDIVISFTDKLPVTIHKSDLLEEDISLLISTLINSSKQNVIISAYMRNLMRNNHPES